METIAEEAKRLLSSVPEGAWITEEFTNWIDKCCAVGHYERIKSSVPEDFSGENCSKRESLLMTLSNDFFFNKGMDFSEYNITNVNNGELLSYQQDSPKERVMALLSDMIKEGY